MESIISLLIFTILLTAVTVMLNTSLRITAGNIRDATRLQEGFVNSAILRAYDEDEIVEVSITSAASSGVSISATHDARLLSGENSDGIIVFEPSF